MKRNRCVEINRRQFNGGRLEEDSSAGVEGTIVKRRDLKQGELILSGQQTREEKIDIGFVISCVCISLVFTNGDKLYRRRSVFYRPFNDLIFYNLFKLLLYFYCFGSVDVFFDFFDVTLTWFVRGISMARENFSNAVL